MSSLLKDLYSPIFYSRFSDLLVDLVPSFSRKDFMKAIFDEHFEGKELKERMRHTSEVLHQFFPSNYRETVCLIKAIIERLKQQAFRSDSLEFMFFPDYIEKYGIDDFECSVEALEYVTQFVSCEFAVRPFIIKYEERMLRQMEIWSDHENYKVRRLASEGSRPRLPWAIALPKIIQDPRPILPLLNNLKQDPSEWVRRSVANNLNDIAKDHPEIVLEIANDWKGLGKETDAIIKHGLRTLLKQGNPAALNYYGLDSRKIELFNFNLHTQKPELYRNLEFSFSLSNGATNEQTVRLEYAIYFKRQREKISRKVFKISERVYRSGETISVLKKHSFKLITTRRYYPGEHQLSIIVNGEEKISVGFELVNSNSTG